MRYSTRWVFPAILALSGCDSGSSISAVMLALNEIVAKPDSGDDWIELHNLLERKVDLEGITLIVGTDSWDLPAGEAIAARGFKVLYCDGLGKDGKASLKLSASGETVRLIDARHQVIDETTYAEQEEGVAWGRFPDGTGDWQPLHTLTPDGPNKTDGPATKCPTEPAALEGQLVINELLSGSTTSADWIELYNNSKSCIDLSGFGLSDDTAKPDTWTFPAGTTLGGGKYLLVYADDGDASDGKLHAALKLSNSGEELLLSGPKGTSAIDSVAFPALDPDRSYGRLPNGTGAFQKLDTPTPGAANKGGTSPSCVKDPAAAKTRLVLNELFSNGATDPDWIELFNNGTDCIDLGGFTLTDDKTNPAQWSFPAGTSLGGGKYLVVHADASTATDGKLHAPFKLASTGEEIQLAGPQGTVVVDAVSLPALDPETSYGRLPDGSGAFQKLASPTPGAANKNTPKPCLTDPTALKSKLVLNEVFSNGTTAPDWIELFLNGSDCVDLSGFALTDDKTQPTQWAFPTGTKLAAGQYLLVYADASTAADGKLHAPFKLSSSGEDLQLAGPGGTVVIDAVTFPAIDPDASYGRQPNGTGAFQALAAPTPGAHN